MALEEEFEFPPLGLFVDACLRSRAPPPRNGTLTDPVAITANERSSKRGKSRIHATPTPPFQPDAPAHNIAIRPTANRSRPYARRKRGIRGIDSNYRDEIEQRRTEGLGPIPGSRLLGLYLMLLAPYWRKGFARRDKEKSLWPVLCDGLKWTKSGRKVARYLKYTEQGHPLNFAIPCLQYISEPPISYCK